MDHWWVITSISWVRNSILKQEIENLSTLHTLRISIIFETGFIINVECTHTGLLHHDVKHGSQSKSIQVNDLYQHTSKKKRKEKGNKISFPFSNRTDSVKTDQIS